MAVTLKALIASKFAAATATVEYTAPASTKTMIDKFTATNTDSVTRTVSVYLVPASGSASDSNMIVKNKSMNAGECVDLSEIRNHVLGAGDMIEVVASVASKVTIRASGREIA